MTKTILQKDFTEEFFDIFEETFEHHQGVYLDEKTSLFDTLDGINAATASIPVGGQCASLAAQVAHITFYMEVLEAYIQEREEGPADWEHIWRTVEKVNPEEWTQIKAGLRAAYQRLLAQWRGFDSWDARRAGGAMAILVHSAYHLGEIRQALCTLT